MSKTNNQKVACVVVRNKDKFLSVSRKDNSTILGFPGGKCDENESLQDCVRRELKEETGLDVGYLQLLYEGICIDEKSNKEYDVTTFLANDFKGEINTKENGVVSWVTSEKLLYGNIGKYNKNVFDVIKKIDQYDELLNSDSRLVKSLIKVNELKYNFKDYIDRKENAKLEIQLLINQLNELGDLFNIDHLKIIKQKSNRDAYLNLKYVYDKGFFKDRSGWRFILRTFAYSYKNDKIDFYSEKEVNLDELLALYDYKIILDRILVNIELLNNRFVNS